MLVVAFVVPLLCSSSVSRAVEMKATVIFGDDSVGVGSALSTNGLLPKLYAYARSLGGQSVPALTLHATVYDSSNAYIPNPENFTRIRYAKCSFYGESTWRNREGTYTFSVDMGVPYVVYDEEIGALGSLYTSLVGDVRGPYTRVSEGRDLRVGPGACEIGLDVDGSVPWSSVRVAGYRGIIEDSGRVYGSGSAYAILRRGDTAAGPDASSILVSLTRDVELDSTGLRIVDFLERTSATRALNVRIGGSGESRHRYEILAGGRSYRPGDAFLWDSTVVSLRADPVYSWPVGKPVTDTLDVTVSIP